MDADLPLKKTKNGVPMKTKLWIVICLLLFSLLGSCSSPLPAAESNPNWEPEYWPTNDWRSTTPEEQGIDSQGLVKLLDYVDENQVNLHSFLIVKNGYLVTEAYYHPYTSSQPHVIASVTKSVISALTGIAIEQGLIKDVSQPVITFFPDRTIQNLDENKKALTVEHLLSLTSGLGCNDAPGSGVPGMEQSEDWIQFMLDLPMVEEPGKTYNYCSGAVQLLSAVLQKATGMTTREYANQNLFKPLGISEITETRWGSDPQGITLGGYGIHFTPREMAKLGALYLAGGRWEGEQVIPQEWITKSWTVFSHKDDGYGYGYLWTIDEENDYYSALGLAGQHILVFPKHNMIVVTTGGILPWDNADIIPIRKLIDEYLLPAIQSETALPPNPESAAQLQEAITYLAQPKKAVQPLPAIAESISEKTFQLDSNPAGWKTILFDFQEGKDEVGIQIDGNWLEPNIGLDNLYRTTEGEENNPVTAFRGSWEDDNTFMVEEIVVGEQYENEYRIVFEAADLSITVRNRLFGGDEITLHGVLADLP